MSTKSRGFTLVEVLVIAPVVILFIGIFIGLLVNLTGESLVMREKNAAIYNSQATLDDIETSIAQATSFLATTGSVASPLGKEDYDPATPASTTAFTNTSVNGHDALIIQAAATNKSPNDSTRKLIYTGTGTCDSKNPLYTYMIVYFVAFDTDTADTADKALYKRIIVPQIPACDIAWQRNSCNPARRPSYPTVCMANDEKLVSGISTFDVSYYIGSNAVAESDSNAAQATDVSVDLGLAKQVAGNSITQSSSVRTNSVNVQAADSSGGSGGGGATAPPANPQITWSRNDTSSTPYHTTFSWGSVGSANNYLFRYNFDGGAWTQQTVAQSGSPSFTVPGTARKQVVNVEVDIVSNAGTYSYGVRTAPATPRWNECTYNPTLPLWTSYGAPYLAAGFTKTKAGIVGLRGLVKNGAIGNTICTLPPEFRPSHRLIFQTAGYRSDTGNGWARVDVLPSGNVIAIQGENPWVSLDGIAFVPNNGGPHGGAPYTWTSNTWQNLWTQYGGGEYAPFRHTLDSEGRVQVHGLGAAGTLGSVVQTNIGAARGSNPTIHMPSMSGATASRSIVQVGNNGDIVGRAGNQGYQSYQLTYYPPSFAGWKTLTPATGWANYGGGWPTLQCYKAADDLVVMRGLVARPTAVDGSVLSDLSSTSPAGGCGSYGDGRLLLSGWMSSESVARFDIAGNTLFGQFNQPAWNAIDGVHFIAD